MEKIKSFFKKLLAIAVVIGLLVITFMYFADYSDGTRAGVPMKLSKKGVLFKTYEAQLNVGGMTNTPEGAIPTVWEFSIPKSNDSVIVKMNKAIDEGKRVKVYYNEKYMRFFWRGDTKYYAYDVEVIN